MTTAEGGFVTTNDDATNIYLTIYCRRLRPNMQIISRSTMERNVTTLHRAGADRLRLLQRGRARDLPELQRRAAVAAHRALHRMSALGNARRWAGQGGAVVQLRRFQGRWKKRLAGLGSR